MQCYIRELVVGISSAEVVPFSACHKLVLGTCRNGTTFDVRNPQLILLSNRNNRVPVLSVSYHISLNLKLDIYKRINQILKL